MRENPSSAPVTVNKIGGKNMSQLPEVANLVGVLRNRGENVTLVVSAFTGITNLLLDILNQLDGRDYTPENINEAFEAFTKKHDQIIDAFFLEHQISEAKNIVAYQVEKLKAMLMIHGRFNNILRPTEGSFEICDKIIGLGGEETAQLLLGLYLEGHNYETKVLQYIVCDPATIGAEKTVSYNRLHTASRVGILQAINRMVAHQSVRDDVVKIFSGYIAGMPRGIAIDVGRSYTDTTAVNVALAYREAGLNPTKTVFWKDVPGVLTADPRDLDQKSDQTTAQCISRVSHREGLEQAASGSELMQLDALALAERNNLDLTLADIRDPDGKNGTLYTSEQINCDRPFKSIVTNPNIRTVTVTLPQMAQKEGFLAAMTRILAEHEFSIDIAPTGGTSMTFVVTVPKDKAPLAEAEKRLKKAVSELKCLTIDGEKYEPKVTVGSGDASVSVVGHELENSRGVLSVISGAFSQAGINIKAVTHDEVQTRVSFVVDAARRKDAVKILHQLFVEKDPQAIASYKADHAKLLDQLTQ